MKEVGDYIRALRKQRGWTQQALVTASGVGKNYVSKIENAGFDKPGGPNLSAIVRALGGSMEEIGRLLHNGDTEDRLLEEINSLPPEEREARRKQVEQLTDELLFDPKKLDRWIGYGERLREED